ncbi:histidine phosphatase family protein [Hoeflea sp. TYP-13]|uniref:histidine phosphatase family protein n=1 Tax=Hoeflea sp. TYP-13 TaxID=3230023 RepID=UPI0034C68272
MSFKYPFYFLRHGETEWNKTRRTQGQLDAQLNDVGREQARRAASLLQSEPIERIIASPLSRARHTAEAVAVHHEIEIMFDDDLMECHLGDHQGEPHGPWLPLYWTGEYDPPNGETYYEFAARVWAAMERAVSHGPNTLIVAHGGLWIAAREHVLIEPHLLPLPNAVPVHVTPGGEKWQQRVLGE